VLLVVLVAGGTTLYVGNSGRRLNQRAWEATYGERGLPIPEQGPREGYSGVLVNPKHPDEVLGWREPYTHIAGRIEIDSMGLQHASTRMTPRFHLWILGGSVAFGGYASSIESTYYHRLLDHLLARSIPVQITIQAAGAWTSDNELAALRQNLVRVAPDVVVFLNGLNDITVGEEATIEDNVRRYLENMAAALEIAQIQDVQVVFTLQPFFPQKKQKTRLEERVLSRYAKADLYVEAYSDLRRGLRRLELRGATFADCSGALDDETATSFTDIWHFSDPGHELLARCLAEQLETLLSES